VTDEEDEDNEEGNNEVDDEEEEDDEGVEDAEAEERPFVPKNQSSLSSANLCRVELRVSIRGFNRLISLLMYLSTCMFLYSRTYVCIYLSRHAFKYARTHVEREVES
jgi:hypothetical protein